MTTGRAWRSARGAPSGLTEKEMALGYVGSGFTSNKVGFSLSDASVNISLFLVPSDPVETPTWVKDLKNEKLDIGRPQGKNSPVCLCSEYLVMHSLISWCTQRLIKNGFVSPSSSSIPRNQSEKRVQRNVSLTLAESLEKLFQLDQANKNEFEGNHLPEEILFPRHWA